MKQKLLLAFLILSGCIVSYEYFQKRSEVLRLKTDLQNLSDHMVVSHGNEDSLLRVIDSLQYLLESKNEVE